MPTRFTACLSCCSLKGLLTAMWGAVDAYVAAAELMVAWNSAHGRPELLLENLQHRDMAKLWKEHAAAVSGDLSANPYTLEPSPAPRCGRKTPSALVDCPSFLPTAMLVVDCYAHGVRRAGDGPLISNLYRHLPKPGTQACIALLTGPPPLSAVQAHQVLPLAGCAFFWPRALQT